jgi:hypothetical protein
MSSTDRMKHHVSGAVPSCRCHTFEVARQPLGPEACYPEPSRGGENGPTIGAAASAVDGKNSATTCTRLRRAAADGGAARRLRGLWSADVRATPGLVFGKCLGRHYPRSLRTRAERLARREGRRTRGCLPPDVATTHGHADPLA